MHEVASPAEPTVHLTPPAPSLPLPTGPYAFEQSEGRSDDAIAAAHVDLIATSLACQSTRVAHETRARDSRSLFAPHPSPFPAARERANTR